MNTTSRHKVLILGGRYAGLVAASRIAREPRAEVTLIDARPEFTQRIRFHELLAGRTPRILDYASRLGRRGIRFVQARAEALEPARQRVSTLTAEGKRCELEYDTLVLALGSVTAADAPGVAENALRLNDPTGILQAARKVRALAASGGRILVIGGGLTGIEAATELAERYPGLGVTLATHGRVGEDYSRAGSEHLRRRIAGLGIELLEGVSIQSLDPDRAWTGDGGAIPFDLCVWAGGFEAPALAREAGLKVDPAGRALVGPDLRAQGRPDVFVAGDSALASFPDGKAIRMGCVSALPQGAHAGENIRRMLRGEPAKPFDFGITLRCISLGRKNGLVQFTELDDTPRPRVWTDRPARVTKELICRMTYEVVRGELRTGLPLYHWPRSGHPLVMSAAESHG
jgi:NADH dehydrogenase